MNEARTISEAARRPQVCVILPAYNEEANLPQLYSRLAKVADANDRYNFRFLIIDDHSDDQTPQLVQSLAERDPRVCGLRLAKNCGSHAAATSGMAQALGDCVIVMAADLQDPPETIPELLSQWSAGAAVVWAVRRQYLGRSVLQTALSNLYWRIMRSVLGRTSPGRGADFFLIDRRVVDVFNQMPERNRSVMAMLTWIGFDQKKILYDKQPRLYGRSKWTLSQKFKAVIDSITGYTHLPMRAMILIGVAFTLMAVVYSIYLANNALHGTPVEGWSSLMILTLLTTGLQIGMLGILGEYLWRTLDEARQRPYYVIERRINLPEENHR